MNEQSKGVTITGISLITAILTNVKSFIFGSSSDLYNLAQQHQTIFHTIQVVSLLVAGGGFYYLYLFWKNKKIKEVKKVNIHFSSKMVDYHHTSWYAYYSSHLIKDAKEKTVKKGIARSIVRFNNDNSIEIYNHTVNNPEDLKYKGKISIDQANPSILKCEATLENSKERDLRYNIYIGKGGDVHAGTWSNIHNNNEIYSGKMILLKVDNKQLLTSGFFGYEDESIETAPQPIVNFFRIHNHNQIRIPAVVTNLETLKKYNEGDNWEYDFDIN